MEKEMKKIFKYELSGAMTEVWGSRIDVEIPASGKFLSAGFQNGRVVVWYEVETTNPVWTHSFAVLPTGAPVGSNMTHLKTFANLEMTFLIHLYQLG
jgi:hypothetical protein